MVVEMERQGELWEIFRTAVEWTVLGDGLDKGKGLMKKRSQGKLPVMWLAHFLPSRLRLL